ncbi:hypothetical protein BDV97DRAFT_368924 [Delphinella strobiligena]|nr:hypothetical protein BDV97DRAFT_368924 [Delphinella strobiligena]
MTTLETCDTPKDIPYSENAKETPRRIILRLRVADFDGDGHTWEQYPDAVKAYLEWAGYSTADYEGHWRERKHYAHVEPFQALDVPQKRFHIMLDMDYKSVPDSPLSEVSHEIYRIRRDNQGQLKVTAFRNAAEARNIISKIRVFSDVLYHWGTTD